MKKRLMIGIILGIIVTLIITFSSISLSNLVGCACCGCCVGCPGDCNTIGAPFAYYYWGLTNSECGGLPQEPVNQISTFGLIVDIIILGSLIFLIYKFSNKK